MELIHDFKHVFLRLWSVRLAIVAGILSGIEVILPLFVDSIPRGRFAIASFAVTVGSIVARAIAQPSLQHSEQTLPSLTKEQADAMDETYGYVEGRKQ